MLDKSLHKRLKILKVTHEIICVLQIFSRPNRYLEVPKVRYSNGTSDMCRASDLGGILGLKL